MRFLGCLLVGLLLSIPRRVVARVESAEVSLDYVAKRAEQRARKPFHSPKADLPEVLRKMTWDQFREIEFRRDKALWAADKLPFRIEFFHPGYLYQEPVHVNEFTLTHVQPIRFVQDFFNYRSLHIQDQIPADTGYAGLKVLNQLNTTNRWDELGTFLGASYYRLLGKGQRYGLSARGLALDCGETNRPEEFPIFTDWWLGKPQPDDDELRLYAILDSVSCAGAYAFLIRPGETTVADVEAVLYFRDMGTNRAVEAQHKAVKSVGLAPLTSMFWFGPGSERKFFDYRPEVHDSDGLLIRLGTGEHIWRPLNNPAVMRHERFPVQGLRGFGLLQRQRDFDSYQDLFNGYQLVPSVWVEPRGRWDDGSVNLVELPTGYEGLDNVVAFWEPKDKPEPLQPYRIAYTLYWTRETDLNLSANKVLATRVGLVPGDDKRWLFSIDFAGPKLAALRETNAPQAVATCSTNGTIAETQVFYNQEGNNWRVMLKMAPNPGNTEPVDLKCTLKKGEEDLAETWTYLWSPP
jgi:glucans biosynthesis protein